MNYLRETAKLFGMKVVDFADYLGYSRQALYAILNNYSLHDKGRIFLAVDKLQKLADDDYEKEMQAVYEKYSNRMEFLRQFKDAKLGAQPKG